MPGPYIRYQYLGGHREGNEVEMACSAAHTHIADGVAAPLRQSDLDAYMEWCEREDLTDEVPDDLQPAVDIRAAQQEQEAGPEADFVERMGLVFADQGAADLAEDHGLEAVDFADIEPTGGTPNEAAYQATDVSDAIAAQGEQDAEDDGGGDEPSLEGVEFITEAVAEYAEDLRRQASLDATHFDRVPAEPPYTETHVQQAVGLLPIEETEEEGQDEGQTEGDQPAESEREADEEPEIDVTKAARELAEEYGVDLADVDGTGKGGRILKDDVKEEVE